MAAGQRRNRALVPGAQQALEQLKFQVAQEIGIPNYRGYLGDVPARQNGAVGGNMVRRMIALAEQQIAGGALPPPTQQFQQGQQLQAGQQAFGAGPFQRQ